MSQISKEDQILNVKIVKMSELKPAVYNPRKWSEDDLTQLMISIERFGFVDPIIVNGSAERHNVVIGGHFRLAAAAQIGMVEVPVVYTKIPDEQKERELNLRLNKNQGEWDYTLLAEFDESILMDIGFDSEELDTVFDIDIEEPDNFDLTKELEKLDINQVEAKKGDIYQLDESRLLVGDSTIGADMEKLMNGEKADMCFTDPPYILDYVHAKRGGQPVTGFGAKKNRRYLETEEIPDNFTELWMTNIAAATKSNFSIIVYENWKNLRTIWGEMEKYWKVKNMLVWHLANRHQNFASRHRFFSKHDIAMVGSGGSVEFNQDEEPDGLQEEYETALYAISGSPHWESHRHGNKFIPTDFIEHNADDEKQSGQGIIFGTKPLPILIPYIKVLTKRGDLIVEPFGGSGSTLIAATKLKRRCYIMEKSPIYAEVIMKRWENETGLKRKKLDDGATERKT